MRRQELGPRKRQKLAGDLDEDSLWRSDSSASEEDSQSEESSALGEDEGGQASAPETFIQNAEEEDAIPSRFSFKHPQGAAAVKVVVPPRAPSLPPTFVGMGVSSSLVSAMNKMSIHTPTEVQAACIPPLLNGRCFPYSTPRP